MAKKTSIGSTKRFGSRYGRKVKHRFGVIEAEQRKLHKCPYCNAVRVKRIAVGIWNCRKCGVKFTGKAYSVKKKITFKEEKEKIVEEAAEEPKTGEIEGVSKGKEQEKLENKEEEVKA